MKRKSAPVAILIAVLLCLGLFACGESEKAPLPQTESLQTQTTVEENKNQDPFSEETEPERSENEAPVDTEKDKEETLGGINLPQNEIPTQIPPYSGEIFVILNDNIPSFSEKELTATAYESYSRLDALGRTGAALASCGREIMPAKGEERGSISSIKPSGWVQAKYDIVSGKYLYNRCHLIGWQLSAENANPKNLMTGTRCFNTEGMLLFENMIADYIKETGNHVAYRVTPVYEGDNLVANGVRMEAFSVEDRGEGICFHVFVYNVQPGVVIDYKTGASTLESAPPPVTTAKVHTTAAPSTTTRAPTTTTAAPIITQAPAARTVYVTETGKKYHSTSFCSGLSNAKAIYESTLSAAQQRGLGPCAKCY